MRQTHYRISEQVLTQPVGGDVVLFDPDTERYFGLNESAALVWNLLSNDATKDEVVDAFQERFHLTTPQAERDLEALFHQLTAENLIQAFDKANRT